MQPRLLRTSQSMWQPGQGLIQFSMRKLHIYLYIDPIFPFLRLWHNVILWLCSCSLFFSLGLVLGITRGCWWLDQRRDPDYKFPWDSAGGRPLPLWLFTYYCLCVWYCVSSGEYVVSHCELCSNRVLLAIFDCENLIARTSMSCRPCL